LGWWKAAKPPFTTPNTILVNALRIHAMVGQAKSQLSFGAVMQVYEAVCETSLIDEFEL
jgi:hypothetical protein